MSIKIDLSGLLDSTTVGDPIVKADASSGPPEKHPPIDGRRFARDWMGRTVLVRAVINSHARVELREPQTGWVAGYTWRRRGQTVWEDGAGHVFECKGPSTPVMLVCPWPGRKVLDAAFDGVDLYDGEMRCPGWSKLDRQIMREVANICDRDKLGRWLP